MNNSYAQDIDQTGLLPCQIYHSKCQYYHLKVVSTQTLKRLLTQTLPQKTIDTTYFYQFPSLVTLTLLPNHVNKDWSGYLWVITDLNV